MEFIIGILIIVLLIKNDKDYRKMKRVESQQWFSFFAGITSLIIEQNLI